MPALRAPGAIRVGGLSLTAVGAIIAAPSVGLLLTLIAWGAAADRFGERWVIVSGLVLATSALVAAALTHGFLALVAWLIAAGAGGACVNAASGRMVLGWFAPSERGLAMGIRQTAQPLGVAVAAITLPGLAHWAGPVRVLLLPAGLCGLAAVLVAVFVLDPPRPPRSAGVAVRSPYREPILWRIHAASAALVVPQFAISAYTLAYLVAERDWSAVSAGRVLFAFQLAGPAGRIGAGVWSDRAGSRLRPMRVLAGASAALMLAVVIGDVAHTVAIVGVFALAAVVTVADNGLAYASVAELAGPYWAGRVLGAQNTGQNVAAALTPPVLGAVVGAHGYALAFTAVAVFPLLAVLITPVRLAERKTRENALRP